MLRKLGIGALALAGTVALSGGAGAQSIGGSKGSAELDSAAFVKQFPLALAYEGVARYYARDYAGAVEALEQYLATGDTNADSVSVRGMIQEAWIHQYPMALIYEGLGRYMANDAGGAIASWTRYLELDPDGD